MDAWKFKHRRPVAAVSTDWRSASRPVPDARTETDRLRNYIIHQRSRPATAGAGSVRPDRDVEPALRSDRGHIAGMEQHGRHRRLDDSRSGDVLRRGERVEAVDG